MPGPFSQRRSDLFQVHQPRNWRLGSAAVILAVIPPGITRKTRSDQTDGPADLTSKDVTRWYPMDGAEATHNRSVAGSRPASPTEQRKPAVGVLATCWRTWSFRWSFHRELPPAGRRRTGVRQCLWPEP